jgi:hypothetical protein
VSCFFEFSQGSKERSLYTHSDFEVVVEFMFLAVLADIELVGDGLAVDCVEQRVHCAGYGLVKTEVFSLRYTE